ncbi:hypothetical protein, partial [Halomonas sp. ND22Bw]|uniref:hypothetical protein n=1 Tax=Halomonas sp. ND22Bw TaxID=2054178 RepID=UPI001C638353
RPSVGGGGGDEVYVAATSLRAGKGPAQLLMSAAFSFNIWDLQHFMLILRRSPLSQVLDFPPLLHQIFFRIFPHYGKYDFSFFLVSKYGKYSD